MHCAAAKNKCSFSMMGLASKDVLHDFLVAPEKITVSNGNFYWHKTVGTRLILQEQQAKKLINML
jgi:hypothetical protein